MASSSTTTTPAALARLDWETNHFDVSAARLATADLTDAALVQSLQSARQQQIEWLVWATSADREVSREVLAEFGGELVDRKATFERSLSGTECQTYAGADCGVIKYTSRTVSPELLELAIAAGAYSRFRVDRHIPPARFEAMYRVWIERSVAGELADAILVVPADDSAIDRGERPLGMITLRETAGVGSIGLVAVAAGARGRGIGSALIHAAHDWMRSRGAHEAQVVTQLSNEPACRLYHRAGYHLARVQPIYHFWL